MAKLRVTLVKSLIGRKKDHIATANALGLRKIRKTALIRQQPKCKKQCQPVSQNF